MRLAQTLGRQTESSRRTRRKILDEDVGLIEQPPRPEGLAYRHYPPETIARIRGSRFARYEEALARDGIAYLAAIRILPIVPAWVGNLLPVAIDMRLRWVFLATLVGVAPLSVVVAGVGSRLQNLTEAARVDIALLLDPATLLPLFGLLLVALLPVAARRWWRRSPR